MLHDNKHEVREIIKGLSSIEIIIVLLTMVLYCSFFITSINDYGRYILLGIVVIIVVFMSISNSGVFVFRFDRFQKNVLIFAIFCFFSAVWALNPNDAIEKGFQICEMFLCMGVLYSFYDKHENSTRLLIEIVLIGNYFLTVYNILIIGTGGISSAIASGVQISDTFDNRNTIALLSAIAVIISLYLILNESFHFKYLLSIVCIYNIAASGSRKAFLALLIGCFLVVVFKAISKNVVFSAIKIVLVSVLAFFIIKEVLMLPVFSGVMHRIDGTLALLTGNLSSADNSSIMRSELMNLGISLFLRSPIVGVGMGNAHLYAGSELGFDTYLHNNFAEILGDGGLVGFVIYYSLYFVIIKNIFRNKLVFNDNNYFKLTLICIALLLFLDVGRISYYSKGTYFYFMIFFVQMEQQKKCKQIQI